jgi:catechol 2,3-dioxygenase-like lactoylglutathione lyase family enzyme
MDMMNRIGVTGVLETALYVADLDASERFYHELFGFETMLGDHRLRALSVAGKHVLLLFKLGGSTNGEETPGGFIPPHDGHGQLHLCFAIEAASLEEWKRVLEEHGVEIESIVHPPRGGTSVYFRDPDGHAIELATPGIWPIY